MVSISFFKFPVSFIEILTEIIYSSLNSLSVLVPSVLNSASDRLLTSMFSSFSGVLSCALLGTYFFVSSFWFPLCVCFCVLVRLAISPSLGKALLWAQWHSLPGHLSQVLQGSPLCGMCVPSYSR